LISRIRNLIGRLWRPFTKPSPLPVGIVILFFFVAGIAYMRAFDWSMDVMNTETFCIGCHEMKDNVYPAYTESIHYSNRSGVRAVCSDCHVPHKWSDKIVRKVQASKELWGKITGKIDTREKFLEHRLHLAQREWKRFEDNDSLECRNCHDQGFMSFEKQRAPGVFMHTEMIETGQFTCVNCHKGIAHELPAIEGLESLSAGVLEPTMRPPFDHSATTLE
jgi:cytochrome c-type protein NapC